MANIVLSNFKKELFATHTKQVQNFFDGNQKQARQFMSSVMYCMEKIPRLLKCSKSSLMAAFMTCAEYQLYPSRHSGECHVIPYGDEATFQLGYQGIITLIYRSGNIKNIYTEVVYENDNFEYAIGLNPVLEHAPELRGDRGEPIGVYTVVTLKSDEKVYKFMTQKDVFKFRAKSQAYNKESKPDYKKHKSCPWWPNNDPDLWMWKKTCIKQLSKILPKSMAVTEAIARDTSADIIQPFSAIDEADPDRILNPAEINNMVTNGRSCGLSIDEIAKAVKKVTKQEGDELDNVTANQEKLIYEEFKLMTPDAEDVDDAPVTVDKMANMKDIKKLIDKGNKAGVNVSKIFKDAKKSLTDSLTENEYLDLSTTINDAINAGEK